MFPAPPVRETTVFATLPESLRLRDRANELTRFVGGTFDSFLEGPAFDRQGNLYCVDVPFGRIFRIDPHGRFELFIEYDGEPNGIQIHRDGRLFVADRRRGIVSIDPASRAVSILASRYDLEPFRGPNDLVFASNGDLYFTDQGMSDYLRRDGRVFRLGADGELTLVLADLPSPNGIAVDPSGRHLYIAVTRDNSILKVPLLAGRASRVLKFIQLSGGGGPDGIAMDAQGGIAIAHPQMGCVWLFDSRGQPTLRVDLCRGLLGTNLAFGGSDGRTLFITESETATIHTARTDVPGLRLFSHQG